MSEEYSVGYSEGYQAGWNAAMDATLPAAQPAQEPIGKLNLGGMINTSEGLEYDDWDVELSRKTIEALQERLVTCDPVTLDIYTTPQQRKPLTDEQINEIAAQGHQRWIEFAQAIEAAHGIKEKNI